MPSYSYQCRGCNEIFRIVHSLDNKPELICSACGSKEVGRVLKGAGFHITGPGVYREGYSPIKVHKPTPDGKIFTGENE